MAWRSPQTGIRTSGSRDARSTGATPARCSRRTCRVRHTGSGKIKHAQDWEVDSYLAAGWERADSDASGDGEPNQSDTKAEWVAYAESQGIDTDGMTKDEVIDAVEGA